MSDEDRPPVWRRSEPDSPCQTICLIDPATRLCIGCNRTADEISGWARMTSEARLALKAELPNRRPAVAKRKGGRSKRIADRNNSR